MRARSRAAVLKLSRAREIGSGFRERYPAKHNESQQNACHSVRAIPNHPPRRERELGERAHGVQSERPLMNVAKLQRRRYQPREPPSEAARLLPFPPDDSREKKKSDGNEAVE